MTCQHVDLLGLEARLEARDKRPSTSHLRCQSSRYLGGPTPMKRPLSVLAFVVATPCIAQTPQTRLWDAAISGDTSALAAALKDGAPIEGLDRRSSQNGRRALNWTAINNRADAIRFLLARGAQIRSRRPTSPASPHCTTPRSMGRSTLPE